MSAPKDDYEVGYKRPPKHTPVETGPIRKSEAQTQECFGRRGFDD
jgi:hypothetical protein